MQETPAKYLYRVIDERAGPMAAEVPLLSVSISRGVIRRDEITDKEARADDLANYKLCAASDIVINRMSAYQGALGISPRDGLISPDYLVLRARAGTEARFLTYLFRSTFFVGEMAARLRGIGSTDQGNVRTPRINEEDLGRILVGIPPFPAQSAIADYLDRETARIDALIEAKGRMTALLVERFNAHLMGLLFASSAIRMVPIGRMCSCLSGYAFSSAAFVPYEIDAVKLLRGVNVTPGSIRWDDVVYISQSHVEPGIEAYSLRAGDLVIGMDRPLIKSGMRVSEIKSRDLPALLVQRVARIRANSLSTNAFLRYLLMSPAFGDYFSPIVTGVSVPHISEEQILSFRVPMMSISEQNSIVAELEMAELRTTKLRVALQKQSDLLREHRQSLITAVVTGQLDVPEAA